jgi:thiopeptide-type bacteriocin biosynthesis protein
VARELRFAVRLLARVAPAREDPALVRFRSDFERRYGARPVPLLEAVDPDCGVVLHDESAPEPDRPTALLLELLERGRASGEVELSDADLASLESAAPRAPLPDAFALKASLHAAGTAAIDAGEFSVVEPTLSGPSGARMLGRLCDGDPELTSLVGDHLRAEEACRPDALFAELTCVPDTNWGPGMSYRPVLREWEIEYGGCSGAPPDRRLEASDLLLVLVDGELVVHSRRLGRRLLVRTSSAVNPRWLAMPAARLLRLLEEQGCAGDRSWSWGALALAPALPRVRRGRIILSRRRWTLPLDGLPQIDGRCDARAYRAVDRWRRAHGLPGRVDVSGVKGELPVDLGSVQSVEVFLAAMAGVERAHLVEAASADDSPLEGPDGRYAHELIVPWVARGTKPRTRVPRTLDVSIESSSRRFAPGSRWLYAKLYGPASAADAMLREVIAALDRDVGLGRWFFVRYADPDRHLRLRFDAEPNMLCSELLPALHAATQPHLSDGRLHRFALDTYEREVERYGGLGGVELMERAAHVDSVAALELLTDSGGDLSRHLLAVASVGALLADAGLELAERERLCAIARAHLTPPGASLPALLGGSERSQRSAVEHILAQLERGAREDASPAFEVLGRRSAALRPLLEELRRCELHQPLGAVLAAIAHMHINRLLLESGGVAELRVHDALARAYHARSARAK